MDVQAEGIDVQAEGMYVQAEGMDVQAEALNQSNTTHEINPQKSQAPENGCTNIRNMLSSK
jgi:hypothetical protein